MAGPMEPLKGEETFNAPPAKVFAALTDLDDLAKAPAILPVTARIRAQFLAPDHPRASLLGRLDWHGHDTRGEGRGVQPMLSGPCAHAARVEHQDLGPLARLPRRRAH